MTPARAPFWAVLRDLFVHNFRLKLLALCFSLGLFAYHHGQRQDHQRTVAFDVISRLPPESAKRALLTALPSSIHVTLRGALGSIDRLSQSAAPVDLDLRSGAIERITFDEKMLSLPPGVAVISIDPPSIDLEWQAVVEREVGLQASISGEPAEGYVVKGAPVVAPDRLLAAGPSSKVEVMQFARLAPFDVSGLTEGSYRRRVAIDPPPERVRYKGPSDSSGLSALVTVQIARRMSEAKFTSRPVQVIGVPVGFATPASVDVTVIGPPEVVRALRPEQVNPRVDLSLLPGFDPKAQRHGSATLKVVVDLAKAEAEIQPPSVSVRW
jgi:hypothetical protein